MKELLSKRFWLALLLGGPFAVGILMSLIGIFVSIQHPETYQWKDTAISIVAYIVCLFGTLWATGFWGRWYILAFFACSPFILLGDLLVNPFAPVGTVLLGILFLWLGNRKSERTSNA